ncbi:MAG: aminopeptidase N [Thermodesulfobacteriota bacterium]
MPDTPHQPVHLKDYRPPACLVDTVLLRFRLDDRETLVDATLNCRRNPAAATDEPLVLHGRDLEILDLTVDKQPVAPDSLRCGDGKYILHDLPPAFELHCRTRLRPGDNTSLEGLYRSGSMFCTQCEAEGFRKITLFPDRPDVLARYTTVIDAPGALPVLLANGNRIETGELENGRHYAVWQDPYPKPSYLFALVAGDLDVLEDRFTTASGREVRLEIYSHRQHMDKCGHAMASLKQAMRWDEETFGLEYDLDRYMIVAVDDFNMGAMENKGLNIFNAKYVLCRPDTATDTDYEAVAAVIAHEYFHNWTGNRVTCRDWFQLSLKEGLTVFRDQQFSADLLSGPVQRITDVQVLRASQFKEDSGPLAHPVRPQSYIEINNFYTVTVYEKGAEIIRMLHTLLGKDLFRQGLRRYLADHDGGAATTDDFVAAMEAVSGRDLGQFRLWYDQAGTPNLACASEWNRAEQTLTLVFRQSTPPTPGQPDKAPQHIPVAMALLDDDGGELPLAIAGEETAPRQRVLELTGAEQSFTITGIRRRPVVSLLRDFSAPVRLDWQVSAEDRCFLFRHDPDPFNRWEAGQQLAATLLLDRIAGHADEEGTALFLEAFAHNLADPAIGDDNFRAQLLTLPSEEFLADRMTIIDPEAIHRVREEMRRAIASACTTMLRHAYESRNVESPYRYCREEAGRRRLKNLALAYLCSDDNDVELCACYRQFTDADNMTDAFAALHILSRSDNPWRQQALDFFAGRWRKEALVMDKWLALQASAPLPKTLDIVRRLLDDPAFSLRNPNRVRALIGSFAHANPVCFHGADGRGYQFVAEQILALDPVNPQIASRLATCFSRWRRFTPFRQELMGRQLERIAATPSLSRDTFEVVSKTLAP